MNLLLINIDGEASVMSEEEFFGSGFYDNYRDGELSVFRPAVTPAGGWGGEYEELWPEDGKDNWRTVE